MFGLDPVMLAVVLAVGLLAEVALLWIAAALADAPEQRWPKLFVVGMGVFLGCFLAAAAIAFFLGVLHAPLAEDKRSATLGAAALAILASAVLPALAYPSLLSVSMGRGLWVGVLQTLLRVFLYVMLTAIVMVVLAVLQISRGGSEKKPQAALPVPAAARL